ncbi:MAG: aspartate-alanine antiporter, partial [Acetobacteraceae bacterium]|nr:aspartate-alanine antiporter [Acetobacteraceae bacterium]
MWPWLVSTLQAYPEIAVFLSLAIGYWVGRFTWKGIGLGAVTATLLAAIVIGQLHITVSPNLKAFFFLMFLFAVGYGVGPQFVRGIAQDGFPQALFSVLVCLFCLVSTWIAAKIAGYDPGFAAGLFAGSQTISASMGLATDAINRLGLPADQAQQMLNAMPVAYAVTYIFGTIGSALLLAIAGPALLRIDLPAACKAYEERMGGKPESGGEGMAWHHFVLRAYELREGMAVVGKTAAEAEGGYTAARLFVERIRRNGKILEATPDTVLAGGDIVAVAGPTDVLVQQIGTRAEEVNDPELLSVPFEGVDVLVTSKVTAGKTLAELAKLPVTHGVFLRRIRRGAIGTDIPILPGTRIERGDVVTLIGRTKDIAAVSAAVGYPDHATSVADVAFIGGAITLGALVGALVWRIGSVPLTLSTAGGVLISGLVFGWLRSVHPTFGRIPSSTVWFMNSVGLNVFIAVVGLTAGPSFVAGIEKLGIGLFLWGVLATTVPLVLGALIGRYVFRFDPAIVLGCCAGARTTTAALG